MSGCMTKTWLHHWAEKLNSRVPFELAAITVDEIHRGMFAWIELQKRPVPIVLGLISIVAVFRSL